MRISYQSRAWFNGPGRAGLRAWSATFGFYAAGVMVTSRPRARSWRRWERILRSRSALRSCQPGPRSRNLVPGSLAVVGAGHCEFIVESAGEEQALRSIDFLPYPEQLYLEVCGLVFPDAVAETQQDQDDLPDSHC